VNPEHGDNSEIRPVDSAPHPKAPGDGSGTRASVQTPSSIPPSAGPLSLSRQERIEQKVREAERRLRELGTEDSRARLLQVAVLRRDEALLDAILASLD
jgi:hypothetical protein